MKKYQIQINGCNFLIEINGVLAKHGFYTNRYVEATDESEAEYLAMDLIRQRDDVRNGIKNKFNDAPKMFAEEIFEMDGFEDAGSREEGFAWYKEDESAKEADSGEVYEAHITRQSS